MSIGAKAGLYAAIAIDVTEQAAKDLVQGTKSNAKEFTSTLAAELAARRAARKAPKVAGVLPAPARA